MDAALTELECATRCSHEHPAHRWGTAASRGSDRRVTLRKSRGSIGGKVPTLQRDREHRTQRNSFPRHGQRGCAQSYPRTERDRRGTRRESRRGEPGGGATCRPGPPRPVPSQLSAEPYRLCRGPGTPPAPPAAPAAGRTALPPGRPAPGRAGGEATAAGGGAGLPRGPWRWHGAARLPGLRALHGASSPAPAPAGRPAAAGRSAAGGRGAGGGTARPHPGWPPPPSLRRRQPIPPAPGADAPPTPYAPRGGRVPGGLPSGSLLCAAPPNGRPARPNGCPSRPTVAPQSLRAVWGKAAARGLRRALPEGRVTRSP